MEIVMLRHGETDENRKNKYLGHFDIPLNHTGRSQAREVSKRFQDEAFELIFSSPQTRAMQTARILCENRVCKILALEGLKEQDFGIFDNMTYDMIKHTYPKECALWDKDWNGYVIPEGESASMAYERSAKAINEIIRTGAKKILVISHLGTIRNMIAYLLGTGQESALQFRVENAAAARLCKSKIKGFWYLKIT